MKRLSLSLLFSLIVLFTFGCSHNYYNIPRETYEQRIRTLGVLPIFVDADSDIRHPEKETLIALIKDYNRKNEPELVAGIKNAGSYFSVALIPEDPDKLFPNIFFRREKRDDAGIVYNKYFYKGPEIRDVISRNKVDALMLLVVSGMTIRENFYSSNFLSKLESDYNSLFISGQIIDLEGNILWEFPNFRQTRLSYPKFLELQYPGFDEARANETDMVDIKYKTIPGINRFLGKSSPSAFRKDAAVSDAYYTIFNEMIAMLRHPSNPFISEKKAAPQATSQSAPANQSQSVPANLQPVQPTQPLSSTPATIPPADKTVTVPAKPITPQPLQQPVNKLPNSPPAEQVTSPSLAPAN